MEICAVAARGDVAGADHEVAEALAFLPPGDVSRKQWIEGSDDANVIKIFGVELVHARAVERRAEIEVVAARPFADQADLGEVRPRAAVRASGHADDDVVGRQSVRCKFLIERIEQLRQIALALGQREPAGRQRDTGHRIASQARPGREQAGLARDALDLGLLLRWHIGDDQVLVWRDAEIAIVHLRDGTQRTLLRGARHVVHTSVLYVQCEMATAVSTFSPAIAVAGRSEYVGLCRRQLDTGALLDFRAEWIEPAIFNRVLETRVLAVLAVSPVTLHGDDRFGDLHRIFRAAEAH